MYSWIKIGTTIFYHDNAVVCIGSVEHRGENDATSGNPEQNQGVDLLRSEDHIKVRSGKSADPVFGDGNVVSLGSS